MFVGLIAVFVIPDMPHNARGFSKEERALAMQRMTEDVGTADDAKVSTFTAFKLAMGDYKYVDHLSPF